MMKKLICKLFGHKWKSAPATIQFPYYYCDRCGEKTIINPWNGTAGK